MIGGRSLRRRLALLTSLGFVVVWLVATGLMALVLQMEMSELLDLTLRETAELFRPVLTQEWQTDMGAGFPLPQTPGNPDEDLVYLLRDRDGTVLLQSGSAAAAILPQGAPVMGYSTTASHAFYTTGADANGRYVTFGDPLTERFEAYRDSLLGFVAPMLAMLPLAYLLVSWIVRTGLRPLAQLTGEIALRDPGRLDPIDTRDLPEELRSIVTGLNALLARLAATLNGERAFATNAAHELRTPVAVALAQVQRLRALSGDPGTATRIDRVEAALTRMAHLVARLLQLARADAGIGIGATDDLTPLLHHVLDDLRRDPARTARLRLTLPDGPVPAAIDADAFAILAGNLIDNAYQHAAAGADVAVTLSNTGALTVTNVCAAPLPGDLTQLAQRFHRGTRTGTGFGLGLHIADTIARQAGGTLTLTAPDGGTRFEVRFAPRGPAT